MPDDIFPIPEEMEIEMDDKNNRSGSNLDISRWLNIIITVGALFVAYGKNASSADQTRDQVQALQTVCTRQSEQIGEMKEKLAALTTKIDYVIAQQNQQNDRRGNNR